MKVERWSESNKEDGQSLLERFAESSMYLLSNIDLYGTELSDEINSGNYYILYDHEICVGVFYLARRGNILLQLDDDKYCDFVYDYLKVNESQFRAKGTLADDRFASKIWKRIKEDNPNGEDAYTSTENLYSLKKNEIEVSAVEGCRFLDEKDFESYYEFVVEYCEELNIPNDHNKDKAEKAFLESIPRNKNWGFFVDGKLVSKAATNAEFKKLIQVGGVYTPPKFRKKGFSKACMKQLVFDIFNSDQFSTIILFTGVENIGARKVYESIGFKMIGYYGMYFLKE